MKKIFSLFLLFTLMRSALMAQTLFSLDKQFHSPEREVRAMWLTTLKGLDWPKKPARTAEGTERQKQELCQILDQLQAAGINTIMFQSRIRSTTAYPSSIEPWDGVFTGTPGKAPLYDPLKFALEECHRRGMELHAWVVAFPICDVYDARKLGRQALPSRKPKLCQRCGNKWMMDPGVPGTDLHIASICAEIVKKYDVDGIHLDYVRYPEKGIPFNDNRTYRRYGKGQKLADWRRANVTRTVKAIHDAVKSVRPWVKISCSPVGKYADLNQQSSYGWNARDAVYQEAQAWLRDGLMDMLFPMMYFDGKHFYPFAIDWQDHAYGRQIVPGLGIYFLDKQQKDWELDIIRRQMFFLRSINAAGQAHFRSEFFTKNVKGLYDFSTRDFYHQIVLPPAMTWEDSIAPTVPQTTISEKNHKIYLSWMPAKDNMDNTKVTYNVYYCDSSKFIRSEATPLAYRLKETQFTYQAGLPTTLRGYYAVTAMDVFGNESDAIAVSAFEDIKPTTHIVQGDGFIDIPSVDKAEYLLILDIAERQLFTMPYAQRINVSKLAPGAYEVRSLAKKGISHHLCHFWKE